MFKAKLVREQASFAFFLEKKKEHDASTLAAKIEAREQIHDSIVEAVNNHMTALYTFETFRKVEDGMAFMERATAVPLIVSAQIQVVGKLQASSLRLTFPMKSSMTIVVLEKMHFSLHAPAFHTPLLSCSFMHSLLPYVIDYLLLGSLSVSLFLYLLICRSFSVSFASASINRFDSALN